MKTIRSILLLIFLGVARAALGANQLGVGAVSAPPGGSVSVPVQFQSQTAIAAAQFDLLFDPAKLQDATVGPGAALAGHKVVSAALAGGARRVLVYSTVNAALQNGQLVEVALSIPTDAADGMVPISIANVTLTDPQGQRVAPVTLSPGVVTVTSAAPPRFLSIMQSGRQLDLQLSTLSGRTYVLQSSTNLKLWSPLSTNASTSSILKLSDTISASTPDRFYRALLQP